MKEILFWTVLTSAVFITFLVSLVVGLIKKKRKVILTSLAILFLSICIGLWTLYLFASKSYRGLTEAVRPRSGIEIYTALFGRPTNDCVKVLNYQDQIIPKIDYAIWLHFKTCPDELKRILTLRDYEAPDITSTKNWNSTGPLAHENWFNPQKLGDSVMVFTYNKDDFGNGQYIYCSLDSMEVFCQDIQD